MTPLLLKSVGDFFLSSFKLSIRSLISSGSLKFFDTSMIVLYLFFLFLDSKTNTIKTMIAGRDTAIIGISIPKELEISKDDIGDKTSISIEFVISVII